MVATLLFAAPVATVFAGPGDARCTNQTDALHPPQYIRVQRVAGGANGRVEEVPFWNYVGTVLRGEYGTGVRRSPHWLRVGAIIVKQYAWYYVVKWRGGHNAAGECYHVKDSTADQMYKPQFYTPNNTNLAAMRDTWHMVLRKWVPDKNQSTIFLSGYRTGLKKPCGADAIGHRIYQKSLRDCENKALVLEEMLRKYFEPNLQIVDTRGHDAVDDNGVFNGDLVTLTGAGSTTAWRTYAGGASSLNDGQNGTFNVDLSAVVGQGVGNVHESVGNGDTLADVVMLTNTGGNGRQLLVAKANGTGFDAAQAAGTATSGASQLLVADFTGDQRVDAGLLSQNGAEATLNVMKSNGNGTFAAPVEWWSGELDLSTTEQLAGDTDGDGKADLVVRLANGNFAIAHSDPSCQPYSVWGVCPAGSVGHDGLGSLDSALGATNAPNGSKLALTDFNRDGRDDVMVVAPGANSTLSVRGLRGKGDGTLMDEITLWQGSTTIAFQNMQVVGMNVNSDSLGDLVLVPDKTDTLQRPVWLRASEQSKTSAPAMTPVSTGDDAAWTPADRAL
jgi:hypothetical protein